MCSVHLLMEISFCVARNLRCYSLINEFTTISVSKEAAGLRSLPSIILRNAITRKSRLWILSRDFAAFIKCTRVSVALGADKIVILGE